MSEHPEDVPRQRRIFCNRTLNLRSIQAIGYDMDYTLVHYNVVEWEGRAYEYMRRRLVESGWPVEDLEFQPELVTRGLVIDTELGNIVKANRFGYIKQAIHGAHPMEFRALREAYTRTLVDLNEKRWVFLNTLFSISEACMYAQLVQLLDEGTLGVVMGYSELYEHVRKALDAAHVEGELKKEIMEDPDRYVERDPEVAIALADQKHAGKKLILITNSGWEYTRFMMQYAIEPFLPGEISWTELFDLMIVGARKPSFFLSEGPIFEVATDEGLLKPVATDPELGKIYLGGHAGMVERCFGLDGEQILYVGDHIYGDVNVSKSILRWRTALVLRELEEELDAIDLASQNQDRITTMMEEKKALEHKMSQLRLQLQRKKRGYGAQTTEEEWVLAQKIKELRDELVDLDSRIIPLVIEDGQAFNETWGYLLRAGNDKSHLTRQLERYADVYMSRVSNFCWYTPFMYFRSPRGSLPHDPVLG